MRPLRLLAATGAVALLATGVAVTPVDAPSAGAATTVDWGELGTDGLTLVGEAPDTDVLHLYLAPDADQAALAALAVAVNDPASPRYGEQSSVAEIGRRLVSDEHLATIVDTLAAGGGEGVAAHESRAFVTADLTIAEAEALFGVQWQRWTAAGEDFDIPASTPTLPPALDGLVDSVYGAIGLVTPAEPTHASPVSSPAADSTPLVPAAVYEGGTPTRTGTPDPSACAGALGVGALLPDQIADAYGLSALHEAGVDGAGVRVAVVDGSRYQHSDLAAYRACLSPTATPITDHVIGDPVVDEGTVEAALDLEVISSMAPHVERLDEYMVGSANRFAAGQFIDMLAAPFHASSTGGQDPHVVSLSYGVCEDEYLEDPMAQPAFDITEQVLATAAAARVSVFVSTGDYGSTSCYPSNGSTTEISPSYPATSVYVTAVGGTNLTLDEENRILSTGAWNDSAFPVEFQDPAGSGTGGVSLLSDRPSWQDALVPAAAGRSVPDVALFGDRWPGWTIYADIAGLPQFDGWTAVGGTSAAAPLTASIAALVDQVNLERGQPALGWVNPLLYSLAATNAGDGGPFLDVTLGTNALFPGVSVFAAGEGYDLATGLGSVFADRLAAALADPSAAVGRPALRADQIEGTTVTLVADPVVPGGVVRSYAWDFESDGVVDEVTSTPTTSHRYGSEGAHVASVTVRTSLARTASFDVMFSTAGSGHDGVAPSFTG